MTDQIIEIYKTLNPVLTRARSGRKPTILSDLVLFESRYSAHCAALVVPRSEGRYRQEPVRLYTGRDKNDLMKTLVWLTHDNEHPGIYARVNLARASDGFGAKKTVSLAQFEKLLEKPAFKTHKFRLREVMGLPTQETVLDAIYREADRIKDARILGEQLTFQNEAAEIYSDDMSIF